MLGKQAVPIRIYTYANEKSYKHKPAIREDVLVSQNFYSLAVAQLA